MKPFSVSYRFLVLAVMLMGFAAHADDAAVLKAEVATEQQAVTEAKAAKETAQKKRDELAAQQAKTPNADIERKLKDADYELMMADRKLSSATKSLERTQKKLDEVAKTAKPAVATPAAVAAPAPAAAPVAAPAPAAVASDAEQVKAKAEQEAAKKLADEKAAAEKAAADKARKDEEARMAQQKAAEAAAEAAKKSAEAEAARKKQAAAELGIDLNNCIALPAASANAGALSDADKTLQAYALGDLKRINRLVSEKAADDVPPVSPFPMLEGSKLKPCDPDQKQALKFGYMGNAQYRLETRVLAGQQDFFVKGVIEPVQRLIPEADNGEVYVFFLDLKYQPRLLAYKKSLFDQAEAQPAQ